MNDVCRCLLYVLDVNEAMKDNISLLNVMARLCQLVMAKLSLKINNKEQVNDVCRCLLYVLDVVNEDTKDNISLPLARRPRCSRLERNGTILHEWHGYVSWPERASKRAFQATSETFVFAQSL